jgi:hypothetical protein
MSKLDPIDRWYSEPLDVHVWSHHPEVKELTTILYDELGISQLESRSNNKAKISLKGMLRVLLLDLYVRWLKDPNLATGFNKATRHYKPNSRYNGLYINRKIIAVEKALGDQGYLEVLSHYNDRTGTGRSYTTRIRPSERLTDHFRRLTIDLHDIDKHHNEECIILRQKFYDEEDNRSTTIDIEYEDNDYTNTIRSQLSAYNELLKNTFIDIPSFSKPHFSRLITKGKRAGQKTTISIGPDNKFVRRVFSGGLQGEWKLNGRFYGGWWQQIDSGYRSQIFINDEPTYEYDLKALHPTLLSNRAGIPLPNDPYRLRTHIKKEVSPDQQRQYVKLLVLIAINADNPNGAYAAFRDHDRSDKIANKLVNERQEQLLKAFFDEHPHMEQFLCKGLGLELMGTDGQIANMVIDYFTNINEPVLCIHDSFLINYKKGEELKRVVEDSTYQLTGHRIQQDIKNQRKENIVSVSGNIEGYEKPQSVSIFRPQQITRTEEYKNRKSKFYKWIDTSKNSNEE